MRGVGVCLLVVLSLAVGLHSVFSLRPSVEGPGLFVFTDRMVYGRPADVVVFGIVLDGEGRPVARANISIDVIDPVGDPVYSAEVVAGDDGRFRGVFRLSSTAEEGQYEVQAVDIDGVYGSSVVTFEVCQACAIPPPTTTVTTTLLRTTTASTTFTRNITRLETVFTGVGGGQVITVTTYSVVNGSVVTLEVTKTVVSRSGVESSLLFYVGLGMVAVLAVALAVVARRIRPGS